MVDPQDTSILAGSTIAKAREMRGLNQAELARAVGVDPAYLSRLEAGKKNPTIKNFYKFLAALNCTLDLYVIPNEEL